MVENQFNTSIKSNRTYNRLEFTSSEIVSFLQTKGILHKKICPYTPQQNGVMERKHKYLLETARALLFRSKLPLKYQGECILTATYLINRLPSFLLHNKCPLELLYQKELTYSHIRSFGYLSFSTILKGDKDKSKPRSTPCVFVGYLFGIKGYKVLNLVTKKIMSQEM